MELQVEKEQLSPVEIELKVTVPADFMAERVENAISTVVKNAKIPGFRPGKIPRKVVVEKYGRTITTETVQEVLQEAYRDALKEASLDTVSPGEMNDISFEEGQPLMFKVKVEVTPEISVPDLTQLTVELKQPQVEDDDVLSALDNLRESHAVLVPTDDPIDHESVVVMDFQELDAAGLPIIGHTRKDVELDMRRNNFGEEFGKQLLGLKTGANTIITLPPDPRSKDKTERARLQATIQNVQRKELPQLDDEFAQSVNEGMTSLESLKSDLKRYIELRAQHTAREEMFRGIVDTMLKETEFPVPPRMLEDALDRAVEDASKNKQGNMDAEAAEEFKKNYRPSAVYSLRWYLLRKKLIEELKLEVTDSEYNHELEHYAQIENRSIAEVKKAISHEQMHRIKEDLTERKVLAYLEGQVQIIPRPITLAEFEGRTQGKVITT